MIKRQRGTMDILPNETAVWQWLENIMRRTAAQFGFSELRIPTFEATELFQRGVGDTTDIVQKEMYTFADKDGRSITLRPEGTAGVLRAVLENGLYNDALPLRLWYELNCFRYEKPQAGRYREFTQFGAEMLGTESPAADADMIALAHTVLQRAGFQHLVVQLNSIGCPKCRAAYNDVLRNYFSAHEQELCSTCRERLAKNPLRILDCKSDICKGFAAEAPKMIDNLCPECAAHFEGVKKNLTAMGIAFEIDPMIVRGLDYYTRTVFEIQCTDIGAQSTVCGGGRYDGLSEQLGGPHLPGLGFAMGISRLIIALEKQGRLPEFERSCDVYIAPMGEAAAAKALEVCMALRNAGLSAQTDAAGRSLKAQMKYANKLNARYTVVLGDSELETGKVQVKDMRGEGAYESALDTLAELILSKTDAE